MDNRYLMILEVGKKQEFIFQSKELKRNIYNSALIRWVTDPKFFKIAARDIYQEDYLVYSGGGHTILDFSSLETARQFAKKISNYVLKKYEGLELFIKISAWNDNGGDYQQYISELISKLEDKKAIGRPLFHQKTFGIEVIDSNTKKLKNLNAFDYITEDRGLRKQIEEIDKKELISPYKLTAELDQLNASEEGDRFLAIIHIDGNQMGKRVEELKQSLGGKKLTWEEYRAELCRFSEHVDQSFGGAYQEMVKQVKVLLDTDPELKEQLNIKEYFPIRRIITAGDDICYVADGRIGIETARILLEKLGQKKFVAEGISQPPYYACAGVAIVHAKYPFYKAYQLAEELCSNSKKKIGDSHLSAIDWHLELGDMKESLTDIRGDYQDKNKVQLVSRPYVVLGNGEAENLSTYKSFQQLLQNLQDRKEQFSKGKLVELKYILKQDCETVKNYLDNSLLKQTLEAVGFDYQTYCKGKESCRIFDPLEVLDFCILLNERAHTDEKTIEG